jgi:hypothetical protein
MPVITKRGDALAHTLARFIGLTDETREVCSLICRREPEYTRIQEACCSEDMGDKRRARMERREAAIEAHVLKLVERLPNTDNGPITVKFEGDPRGYCIKLVVPGQPGAGNTWGLGGEFGV